ncbi:hypothetical protein HC256_004104 [Beauveria bassiana]|nr:hypothetical protein HC256_004104 [Beauveria bassiana]
MQQMLRTIAGSAIAICRHRKVALTQGLIKTTVSSLQVSFTRRMEATKAASFFDFERLLDDDRAEASIVWERKVLFYVETRAEVLAGEDITKALCRVLHSLIFRVFTAVITLDFVALRITLNKSA